MLSGLGARARILIAAAVVVVVGVGVGLGVSRPWEDDGRAQSVGPALSLDPAVQVPTSTRPVLGALPPSTLSADEVNSALSTHNTWRQKYKVVPALTWDNDLAAYAQEWATKVAADGNFRHRDSGDLNGRGENLAYGYATPQAAVDAWGNEVSDYDLNAHTCAEGKVCGHFTQVVWSTTTAVGCGKATGQLENVFVCNYRPGGNYTGFNFVTGYTPE